MTAPPRLYAITIRVWGKELADGMEQPHADVPAVIDLDMVSVVRACAPFDTETGNEGIAAKIDLVNEDVYSLVGEDADREALIRAWAAYRTHADRIARLRN